MVYINDRFAFIFIENPKSGSTSILKALSLSLGVPIKRTPELQNAHQTCDQLKELYPEQWKEYLKVTTYRDPEERFRSSANYPRHHQLRGIRTFNQLKEHINNQYPYSCLKPFCQYCIPQSEYLKEIDFIINLDTIQADFDLFCQRVGIPSVKVELINRNNKSVYSNFQINELLTLVEVNK
jgi:hypothetical protein